MKKTIALLVNETVRYSKMGMGGITEHSCVLEAYDSYARALDSMAEEYNSFASERAFKQEKITRTEISEPGSTRPYAQIEYVDSEGVHLSECFFIEFIDLDIS